MQVYRARNPKKSPLWQCADRQYDEFEAAYPEAYEARANLEDLAQYILRNLFSVEKMTSVPEFGLSSCLHLSIVPVIDLLQATLQPLQFRRPVALHPAICNAAPASGDSASVCSPTATSVMSSQSTSTGRRLEAMPLL
jgi:hypothetical protein